MSIFADLTRRFHILTTDAKPDPPRLNIHENSYDNLSTTNSHNTTPTSSAIHRVLNEDNSIHDLQNQQNNSSRDEPTFSESTEDTRKKTNSRTKKKSYSGQAKNIINYNIINSNGVKIGETTTYVCNINQYPKNYNENPMSEGSMKTMTESVKKLSVSKRELTLKDMFLIKTHIDKNWREIFKSLGYSKGQLDQFEENHKSKGMDEMIYQILLDWKRANGENARIGTIVETLWQCRQYDCVEKLATANNKS